MLTSTESISISSGAPTPNLLSNLPGASLNALKKLSTVVVGDKIVISQAPKYITESLAKTEMYEMGVVGTKHVPEELMLNDLSSMFEMVPFEE
jgi:hypothetical protein